MKRILYISVLICCLASCARLGLPSFSTSGDWRQRGNVVENSDMKVQFGGDGLLSNAGNGEYELNFITSEAEFNAYEPKLANYLADVIKQIPLKIDSIEMIFADQFLILTTSGSDTWEPDYVRRADKAVLTIQGYPIESLVQPEDELWRNLIINKSKRQIIVVDRLIKNDRHYAIVYVLQSESKSSPFSANYQYDITNPRNIQSIGTNLDTLMKTSINALESLKK
ncbi:MAG: hypothetical protein J5629_01940 [Muribaculaceae bacterium]|nr:hypothetical protein [Muribaculaceae bacterium]